MINISTATLEERIIAADLPLYASKKVKEAQKKKKVTFAKESTSQPSRSKQGKSVLSESEDDESEWKTLEDFGSVIVEAVKSKDKKTLKEEASKLSLVDKGRLTYLLPKDLRSVTGVGPLPLKKKYDPFDYQLETVKWIFENIKKPLHGIEGVLLQMEMGLGKTLMAMVYALLSQKEGDFPPFVVCSKTLIGTWKNSGFKQFFGEKLKVLYLHPEFYEGSKSFGKVKKELTREEILEHDFVITNYDTCSKLYKNLNIKDDIAEIGTQGLQKGKVQYYSNRSLVQADDENFVGLDALYYTPWRLVIFDESQTVANYKADKFQAALGIGAQYKICLTGTPVRNSEHDLWSQLRVLGLNVYLPKEWGETTYLQKGLNKRVRTLSKQEANLSLPEKKEINTTIDFTKDEEEVYKSIISMLEEEIHRFEMKEVDNLAYIFTALIRLRQSCIAGFLMTESSKGKGDKSKISTKNKTLDQVGNIDDWLLQIDGEAGTNSTKMREVKEIISRIPKDEKIIIFSDYASALDLAKRALLKEFPGVGIITITGSTPNRTKKLEEFQKQKNIRILLLSTKVGSEGLNITEANNCIFLNGSWNNTIHDQAVARAWRFGQKKEVNVYNIYYKNSIEVNMFNMCQRKENMTKSMMEGKFEYDKEAGKCNLPTIKKILEGRS